LRISGDRDGLTATTKAAARLEQELEDLCRTRPVSVLCRYTGPSDAGGPLDQVAAAHAGGLRERQLQTTMQPGRLMLTGEVDLANEAILAPVLMAAAVAGDGLLRVDLEQVSFLSVGGCRALAVATSRFRAEGGWVELRHPQFIVEQALRMSGIDTLANVEVIGSHP
jgi:anti-anti-sigma factor